MAESLSYKVRQEIRNCRLRLGYTQKDLASKIGTKYQVILQYENGTRKISIKKLYAIAEALSISIIDLLPKSAEDEGENELSNLIEEYKKIESQELCDVLIKSLFEGIRVCREKVREAKKIEVAKSLVKEGISVDIISQTTGLSVGKICDSTSFK